MSIQLVDITKRYGNKVVLDGITQEIKEGEFFVILGPSGEGKSTLLKVISGIEKPDKGKIIVNGKDITNLPPEKRNIAMVFQNYALYPNMTVYDNIAFPLKMRKMKKEEIRERVMRVAKLLGISDILNYNVTKISGGQQQRVAVARALVRDPAFFLLDEPLSNLDARTRFIARGELKRVQKEVGKTFIYVTHDQKEAMSLASRVAVLHKGKFEQVGEPLELYEYPKTKWVAQFIGDFPMNFLPGKYVKEADNIEIGFRPEWTDIGGGIKAIVDSKEAFGDSLYLFCIVDEKYKVVIQSKEWYEVGDKIGFEIIKYRKFKDGMLISEEK